MPLLPANAVLRIFSFFGRRLMRTPASTMAVVQNSRPRLILEPANGLGNRLRAIAAGVAAAHASSRQLFVLWRPDHHCNASLDSLLHLPDGIQTVTQTFGVHRSYDELRNRTPTVELRGIEDVHVRTAFVFQSEPPLNFRIFRRALRSLRPAQPVLDALEEAAPIAEEAHVSVHIRMVESLAMDVPGISAHEVTQMQSASLHRRRCHWTSFVPSVRYMLKDLSMPRPERPTILVSADDEAAVSSLASALGDGVDVRALAVSAECYGAARRQERCIQLAYAHMLALAHPSRLILSTWSSYSEIVQLLAPRTAFVIDGCTPPPSPWDETPEAEGITAVVACRDRPAAQRVLRKARKVLSACTYGRDRLGVFAAQAGRGRSRDDQGHRRRRMEPGPGLQHCVRARSPPMGVEARLRHARCVRSSHAAHGNIRIGRLARGERRYGRRWALNRLLVARRDALRAVGGYDERLVHYGWDDSDLYARLERAGVRHVAFDNASCLRHLPHSHTLRGTQDDFDAEVQTQANRLCLSGVSAWNWTTRPRTVFRRVLTPLRTVAKVVVSVPEELPACDDRFAVVIVLHKLWRHCSPRPQCEHRFWSVAKDTKWETPRELVMHLAPSRIQAALHCLEEWRSFVPIESVPACARTLDASDDK